MRLKWPPGTIESALAGRRRMEALEADAAAWREVTAPHELPGPPIAEVRRHTARAAIEDWLEAKAQGR